MNSTAPRQGRPEPPELETASERRLRTGRLAGALFAVAALASIPARALLTGGGPPAYVDPLALLALCTGVACLSLPWGRISGRWLHLLPIVATAQIAFAVQASGPDGGVFGWLFVLVAVFSACAFTQRSVVALHAGLAAIALAAPAVYDPGALSGARALVGVPVLLAAVAAVTLLRERFEADRRALRHSALCDPLTGVGNYGLLHDRLAYELERHARHEREFAVLVLDLDGFKQVNDSFGHLTGDSVLCEVARVLQETVRGQETVARQGGDEFSVLAPETSAEEAAILAGRLRRALGTVGVGQGWVTASVGFAVYPVDGATPRALMARADAALRASKHRRRFVRRPSPGAEPLPPFAPDPSVIE